jgi:hypothetical protein
MDNSKIIVTQFWCPFSLLDSNLPEPKSVSNKNNLTCKSLEFFILFIEYLKTYYSDYHIYICSNGSLRKIQEIIEIFDDSYEFIDQGKFDVNLQKKYHIKIFEENLPHTTGFFRCIFDQLNFCYKNNVDFFQIESDSLIAYNCEKDLENKDFVCYEKTGTLEPRLLFINKKNLTDEYMSFLNEGSNNIDFCLNQLTEGPLSSRFCNDNHSWGDLSQKDKQIHDSNGQIVLSFLKANPIKSKYYDKILPIIENLIKENKI